MSFKGPLHVNWVNTQYYRQNFCGTPTECSDVHMDSKVSVY